MIPFGTEVRVHIVRQALADARTERHKTALAELGVTYEQGGSLEIDVAHEQMRDFANAHPKGVQQRKDRLVDERPLGCSRAIVQSPRGFEQPPRVVQALSLIHI